MEPGHVATVYDVRELSDKLANLGRVGRISSWVGFGIGAIALAVGALELTRFLRMGTVAVSVTGTGFGLFVLGISWWSFRRGRVGAVLVEVDDEGVKLHYRRRRVKHLRWADPHLSFILEDGSVLPAEVTKGGLLFRLNVGSGDTPLTRAAFFDILSRARQHGLVARSGRDRVLLMPPSMWLMDYHIRGSTHRPRHRDESA